MLAFTSQSEFRFLKQGEISPVGSAVFEDPKALSRELSVQEMDQVRSKILGSRVECSLTREMAAVRLWNLLKMKEPEQHWGYGHKIRRHPSLGKFCLNRHKSMVVLDFDPGKNPIKDAIYRSLSRRQKLVMGLLVSDGRLSWTIEEVEVVMSAPDTGWDFLSMYFESKKRLYEYGLLRFLTVEEFLSRTRK